MFAAVPEVKYAKDSLQSNCKGFPSKHCQTLVTLLGCEKKLLFEIQMTYQVYGSKQFVMGLTNIL